MKSKKSKLEENLAKAADPKVVEYQLKKFEAMEAKNKAFFECGKARFEAKKLAAAIDYAGDISGNKSLPNPKTRLNKSRSPYKIF